MKFRVHYMALLVIALAACSSAADTTTTTSLDVASTVAAAASTTEAPDTTTSTVPPTTTTTETATDAAAIVAAKTQAIEAVVPEGWTATTGEQDDFDEGDDFLYDTCQLPNEFDLNDIDSVTSATLLTSVEGPSATPPFPGDRASVEARVFESDTEASDAFSVFERIYGTEDGLQCLTDVVLDTLGDDIPASELTFNVEATTVAGAQAGARIEMSFDIEGFAGSVFVEFQGARMGSCTVIASFISFGEPFDRDVADLIFTAAVDA